MTVTEPLTYEAAFWGDCLNTLDEETKHQVYAERMRAPADLEGRAVVDIGGGPVSMLLKTRNRGSCLVIDPLLNQFPSWVRARYAEAGIECRAAKAEAGVPGRYDEAWIYNVLQHVDDPELVVKNARLAAPVVRLFEWVGIPPYEGHPHELSAADLSSWLGASGRLEQLAERGCHGLAFYGVFS